MDTVYEAASEQSKFSINPGDEIKGTKSTATNSSYIAVEKAQSILESNFVPELSSGSVEIVGLGNLSDLAQRISSTSGSDIDVDSAPKFLSDTFKTST